MPAVPRVMRETGAWFPVEPGMSAAGLEQQLQSAGYSTFVTCRSRRVWFASSPGNAPDPLVRISDWVSQGQAATLLTPSLRVAGDPPAPEPVIDLQNVQATGALRQQLRTGRPIEVMQRWRDECISRSGDALVRLLDTILLPELLLRWPDSMLCFVGPTDRTHALTPAVRAHALREIASWQGIREAARTGRGFLCCGQFIRGSAQAQVSISPLHQLWHCHTTEFG